MTAADSANVKDGLETTMLLAGRAYNGIKLK